MKHKRIHKRFYIFLSLLFLLVGGAGYWVFHPGTTVAEETEKEMIPQISNVSSDARDSWALTLVNASNPLPDDFSVKTKKLPNGLEFDERAVEALEQMLSDGKKEGLSFVVCSAYRSIDKQKYLFNKQIEKQKGFGFVGEEAVKQAKTVVAYPGTSEHNLGLAADIVSLNYQMLDNKQEDTPEQKWLMANCARYGFILRYPNGKKDITGIIYEPWHYRYVGIPDAEKIMSRGLCLEEYLAQ